MSILSSELPLRIGTRGSRLALWQAHLVRDAVQRAHPDVEVCIEIVSTQGDRDQTTPLAHMTSVGVFTKEVEQALRDDRCDVAVHSLKDLPTELAPGFELIAVMARGDHRDVLVSRLGVPLAQLPPGSVIGTSSLRRRSQLLHLRPDLVARDLRGNVQTRLRAVGVELDEGTAPRGELLDATLLAAAGLQRLGLDRCVSEVLEPPRWLPAPGQGAVGVEIRAGDSRAAALLAGLDDLATRRAATAERSFLRELEGGCRVPVGAFARLRGEQIELHGLVGAPDGRRVLRDRASGQDPIALGQRLAGVLRARGADEILQAVRGALP